MAGDEIAVAVGAARWHVQVGSVDLFVEDASFDPPEAGPHAGGANELRAPFNGKVIAVKAEPGRAVAKGDPLVVLESMKMHNEIIAPMDGVVRKVNCRAGEQVGFGHVLVEIESEKE